MKKYKLKLKHKMFENNWMVYLNYDPRFDHYDIGDDAGYGPGVQTAFTEKELESIDEEGFERIEVTE